MKVLKALIIDDEPPAREVLKYYLKEEREVQTIGECENGFQGVKMIQDLEPELTEASRLAAGALQSDTWANRAPREKALPKRTWLD